MPSSSSLLRKNSDQINPNESPTKKKTTAVHATVKRNTYGTQPFDKHWLNLDCCGLVCASLTYMLHAYGVYSFGWILLPPWFSVMDEDGYREVSRYYVGLLIGLNYHVLSYRAGKT